jgi:hypothetical protein
MTGNMRAGAAAISMYNPVRDTVPMPLSPGLALMISAGTMLSLASSSQSLCCALAISSSGVIWRSR